MSVAKSLDHLIRPEQDRLRDGQPERLGRLEIDHGSISVRHPIVISEHVPGISRNRRCSSFWQHPVVPRLPVALEPQENVVLSLLEIGALSRIMYDIEEKLVASD